MRREVGLWIDHTKAIIVTIIGEKDETRQVRSNIKKYVYFSGGSNSNPSTAPVIFPEKANKIVSFRIS